jgi:hypothetical protein
MEKKSFGFGGGQYFLENKDNNYRVVLVFREQNHSTLLKVN